jgi:hypothetical protein
MGHISTSYIDDCLLLAKTHKDCQRNVQATVDFSVKAGFVVHKDKSIFLPTKKIVYLGFWLDSERMTVSLTEEKAENIKLACIAMLEKQQTTIKQLAKLIGTLVASIPGVQYGKLFYRSLDNHKTAALKTSKGNFNAPTKLPENCRDDLQWWAQNIGITCREIIVPKPTVVIETDASDIGWGACVKGENKTTGGHWTELETMEHINYKELLAAWFGIQCFGNSKNPAHIKILSDNTTTVAYINNMGGTKDKCNGVARDIWSWCYANKHWVSAAHLPGKDNVRADKESRSIHDNMEWSLNPAAFKQICELMGTPEIDLFASRLNYKVEKYMSWKPDPHAVAVDSMSEHWGNLFFYAFPPFNMITRVLAKAELELARGIIVVPYWPTQPWWPKFTRLCSKQPFVLSSLNGRVITHPWREEHQLPRMTLMAGLISAQGSG